MPIYEYEPENQSKSCAYCKNGFSMMRRISAEPLTKCPACKNNIKKVISACSIGASKTGLNTRAKNAGFHQLKRIGNGEYEKQF